MTGFIVLNFEMSTAAHGGRHASLIFNGERSVKSGNTFSIPLSVTKFLVLKMKCFVSVIHRNNAVFLLHCLCSFKKKNKNTV